MLFPFGAELQNLLKLFEVLADGRLVGIASLPSTTASVKHIIY